MSLLALFLLLSPTISDTPDQSLDPTPLPELCKCKPGHPAHRVGREYATICCPYKAGPCPWESPCLAGCNADYECNDEPYDPSGLPSIARLHEADGFPCTVESDGETMLGSCGTSTTILYSWECFIDENAHGTCYDNLGYEWGTFVDLSVTSG